MQVARLAGRRSRDPERDGPDDDRRGQEDGRDHAAHDSPLEARPRAVVGHLQHVERAVVVGLDDEDAVNVDQACHFGVDEVVIGAHCELGIGEARHDQAVVDDGRVVCSLVCRHVCGRLLCGHLDATLLRARREVS